tara:strand:+ start:276 stop:494 length:219 start_codon:yes stop_codon:yes gene_type:complete
MVGGARRDQRFSYGGGALAVERGIFNVSVLYKTSDGVESAELRGIFLSDIQKHVPRGAKIVSVVAKRQPKRN